MGQIEIDLTALESGDEAVAARIMREIKGAAQPNPSRFLEAPGSLVVVASSGDLPVGFAYGYILDRPDGDRMMLLYEMEVSAPWRRKGIGRRLVGALRDRATDAGCSSMWLITDDDNVSAQMLYQLEGATAEGTRLQYAWRSLVEGE